MLSRHRQARGFHESLRVGRTYLLNEHGARLEEDGLMAAANGRPIEQFHFLGFYTGKWSTATHGYRGSSRHILEIDEWRISPRLTCARRRQGFDIISRVNEPPPHTKANCAFVHFVHEGELRALGDRRVKLSAVRPPEPLA